MSARLPMLLLLWLGMMLSSPATGHAAPPDDAATSKPQYSIDLVVIGPGDSLFTRGGHVALLVSEHDVDGRTWTHAYNFGDADFDDPAIPLNFVRGELPFFLSKVGDEYDLAEVYGLLQDRDVVRYPVALSSAQAKALFDKLEFLLQPEHRIYNHHYLERTCSTLARDLLDEQTGGEIRRQLAEPDPWTVRAYQQTAFDAHPAVAILSDLFFGRLHDQPIDKYYAMLWPPRMPEYLTEVMVPDPAGGKDFVPLLGAPEPMAARGGASSPRYRSEVTRLLAGLMLIWGFVGGAWLATRGRGRNRLAALWLLGWALPAGLAGLLMVGFEVAGAIPQMRSNELVASLLCTDLLLLGVVVRWWKHGVDAPRWLQRYAIIRAVVVGIAVILRATGLFIQEPWFVPVASLGCSAGLLWLVFSHRKAPATSP